MIRGGVSKPSISSPPDSWSSSRSVHHRRAARPRNQAAAASNRLRTTAGSSIDSNIPKQPDVGAVLRIVVGIIADEDPSHRGTVAGGEKLRGGAMPVKWVTPGSRNSLTSSSKGRNPMRIVRVDPPRQFEKLIQLAAGTNFRNFQSGVRRWAIASERLEYGPVLHDSSHVRRTGF